MWPFVSNPSWNEHKLPWSGFWLHMDLTPPKGVVCVRFWMCKSVGVLSHWFEAFPYVFLMWHDVVWCGMMWVRVFSVGCLNGLYLSGCECLRVHLCSEVCNTRCPIFPHLVWEHGGSPPLSRALKGPKAPLWGLQHTPDLWGSENL